MKLSRNVFWRTAGGLKRLLMLLLCGTTLLQTEHMALSLVAGNRVSRLLYPSTISISLLRFESQLSFLSSTNPSVHTHTHALGEQIWDWSPSYCSSGTCLKVLDTPNLEQQRPWRDVPIIVMLMTKPAVQWIMGSQINKVHVVYIVCLCCELRPEGHSKCQSAFWQKKVLFACIFEMLL